MATRHDLEKLARALHGAVGKRVAGAFLTRYAGDRYRVHLAFDDDTHYEIYGAGVMTGSRGISPGGVDELRRVLTDDAALEIIEVSAEMLAR